MSDSFLLKENLPNGVVLLKMNRPEELNALTEPEYFHEIADTFRDLENDVNTRCIILTGTGKAFCAGGNVKDMRDKKNLFSGNALEIRDRYAGIVHLVPKAFAALSVPVIAAVNGPAIGAGCGIASMCDIRIASRRAKFAESFVKLGIIPGDGAAWILPKILGMTKALELALTGDMLSAEQALACGWVSQVVEEDELDSAALAMANRIAANPPHAVRMTKRLIRESSRTDLGTLLDLSASYQSIAHMTDDHAEAIAAFFEKRAGVYQGR